MISIFSRINKQLASWIAFWQFLRGLDRYTLNLYQDLAGGAIADVLEVTGDQIRPRALVLADLAASSSGKESDVVRRTDGQGKCERGLTSVSRSMRS